MSFVILASFMMVRTDESFATLLFFSYEYLMQRQQAHEKPPKKVMDIVKRLEEGLFKSASTKVCYFLFFMYVLTCFCYDEKTFYLFCSLT